MGAWLRLLQAEVRAANHSVLPHICSPCSLRRERFAEEGQAAKEAAEAPQQTQFDGEGQEYDMDDVLHPSKDSEKEGEKDGKRGGAGRVGEEAGVQDVE